MIAYTVFIARPSHASYARSVLGRGVLAGTAVLCCVTRGCQDELPPRLPCGDSRDGGWLPSCALMRFMCCVSCRRPQLAPSPPVSVPPQSVQHLLQSAWDTDVVHMNIVAGCFHEALGERRRAIAHAGSMLCCLSVAAPVMILANLSTEALPWSVAFIPLWIVALLTLCVLPAKWVFSDESDGLRVYIAAMLCGVLPLFVTLVLLTVRLDGNSQGTAIPMYWVLFPLFLLHGCGMLAIVLASAGTCVQEWSSSSRAKMAAQVTGAACAACCLLAPVSATYVLTSLAADGVLNGFKPIYAFLPGGVLLLCGVCVLVAATGAELRTRLPGWRQQAEEEQQKEESAKRASQGITGQLLLAPDALSVAPVQTTHYLLQPSRAVTASPQLGARAPLLSDSLPGSGGWGSHSFSGRLHAAASDP